MYKKTVFLAKQKLYRLLRKVFEKPYILGSMERQQFITINKRNREMTDYRTPKLNEKLKR